MAGRRIKAENRHDRSVIVLGCSFFLGCLLGIFFVTELDTRTAKELSEFLADYFELTKGGAISRSVPRILWNHGRWVILCTVAGFSATGIVFLPVLTCFRGFLLSFSISCFAYLFGRAGMVPAIVLFGLSAMLWLPSIYILAAAAMECSAGRIAARQEKVRPIAVPVRKFRKALLLSVLILVVCVCVECWIVPLLLPFAAGIIR